MTITTHHAPPRPENRFVQQARRGLQPAVARVALTNRSIGPDGNGPLPPTAAQRALDAQNRRNNAYGFYLANSKEANRLEAQRQAIANVRSVAEKLLEAALADYLKDRSPANFSRVDQQSRSVARSRAAEQSLAQQVAAQRNAAQRNYNIWQNGTP